MEKQTQTTALTSLGYWALLNNAGIERLYRVGQTQSCMARNRRGEHFLVRDPDDLSPEQRADIAEEIIALNGN